MFYVIKNPNVDMSQLLVVAAVVAMVVSFIVYGVIYLRNKNIKKNDTIVRCLKWFINTFYVFCFVMLLFPPKVKLGHSFSVDPEYSWYQFTLFKSIIPSIEVGNYSYFIGNILVGLSIPVMLKFNFNKLRLYSILIISIFISLGIKVVQALINIITAFPNRIIDIDTVILYLVGIVISLFLIYIEKILHRIR